MAVETLIILAMLIPLCGAVLIALAGRIGDNVREAATLVTAGLLAVTVWQIIPVVYEGGRPGLTLTQLAPGIEIAALKRRDAVMDARLKQTEYRFGLCDHP